MRNPWSFLIFLSVVLLVTGLIHFFLYRGLVRGLSITSPALLWPLRALAVLLALSYVIARWMDGWAPHGAVVAAHWTASIWLGLMFHLLWTGLALSIVKIALRLTGVWGLLAPHHAAMGKAAVLGVVATAVVLGAVGTVRAYGPARVRTAKVPVKAIDPALAGLRIVMVADFHAGVLVGRREVDRRGAEINALDPDVILVPGDLVDHPPERIPEITESYRRLRATHGVFVSTGNHEYIVGRTRCVEFLRRAGMTVLGNEWVELPEGLVLAGVEDPMAGSFGLETPPLETVLGPRATERAAILLSHTPTKETAEAAVAAGADLVVSGHTHGGQVWPFGYVTRLAYPLHYGLYEVGRGRQLTTSGIGFWGPPMRLGADPEIWVIELVEE